MIIYSYTIENHVRRDDQTLCKHLDLLRVRFDPNSFTPETIGEYRIHLMNELQEEINDWSSKKLLKGMNI